ncbi:hypothetical protein J6590_006956 [Homalodisca vitripennis]|nr:hypothetical protein J6590_006956 [Homalodisca vitripennis]
MCWCACRTDTPQQKCSIYTINGADKASKRKRLLPRSESPYLPPDGRYPTLGRCTKRVSGSDRYQGQRVRVYH